MAYTNNGLDLSRNVEEREESASDALVKFLMSKNIPLDVSNNSYFQDLLRNVAQQGQQASLFLDYSAVVQNSLWKIEDEIKQFMRMVIDSWRTTRCTRVSYNLKGSGGNQLVLGFYCPKGFIFFQGGRPENEVGKDLADLVSDSSFELSAEEVQFVRHEHCYHSKCQYQACDVTTDSFSMSNCYTDVKCVRQQIHVLWMSICKTSKWVQSLIKKADEVFHCLAASNLSEDIYNTLKQKGFEYAHASSFARLRMVMRVRPELTVWASRLFESEMFDLQTDTNVTSIMNNNEFWSDGNQLVQVFAPFYKLPSLMDTLVPSSGYLLLAIDKASSLLKIYSESEPLKYEQIWECFQTWRLHDCAELNQHLAFYLNPSYHILDHDFEVDIDEIEVDQLYSLIRAYCEDDQELVDAELQAYRTKSSNPFACVPEDEFEATHPIALWSKYGGRFPILQRCAYILLSQPASCLCKQLEKHASKLRGSDNFILRLNGLMMEEFAKLGEQIYQPIHV